MLSTARLALIVTVSNIDRLLSRRDLQRLPTIRQARSERMHSGTCKSQLTAATLPLRCTHMLKHMVTLVMQSSELITTLHLEFQIRERSVRQRRRGASCRHANAVMRAAIRSSASPVGQSRAFSSVRVHAWTHLEKLQVCRTPRPAVQWPLRFSS